MAEYSGATACFRVIQNLSGTAIIRGDSKLVVCQLMGEWNINGGLYVPYYQEAKKLFDTIRDRARLEWIPRDKNDICDDLSKSVLRDLGVEFRLQPEKNTKIRSKNFTRRYA